MTLHSLSPAPQILRISPDFFPMMTGITNQALAISKGLSQYGISSPIITTTQDPTNSFTDPSVSIYRFKSYMNATNLHFSPPLLSFLSKTPASLFHIHGWRNPTSDGAFAVAYQRRIPAVVQAHGVAFGYRYSNESIAIRTIRQLYDRGIRKFILKFAKRVIASTALEANELEEYGFLKARIAVIPVGVRSLFFQPNQMKRERESRKATLLFVGRLGPRRNIEQIIRTLAIVRSQGFSPTLRIIGPEVKLATGDSGGYRRDLENLAKDLNVFHSISFLGPLYGEDLLKEYHAADIFLYPSLYENFGQPIAEAAAAGLPIVATPTGVAIDLLRSRDSGFMIPFHDTNAFASALIQLMTNPGLIQEMGDAAARYARNEFNWDCIIPRYIELYREILDEEDRR